MSTTAVQPSPSVPPVAPAAPSGPGGGALSIFVAAVVLGAAGIWGYARLGGGAAGAVGLAVLLAPCVLVVAAWLAPALRRRVRARPRALTFGLLLPYLLCSWFLPELVRRERFDSAAWKSEAGGWAEDRHRSHRLRQIDHLLASRLLDGKTRAQVLELLGPDDGEAGNGSRRGVWPETDAYYYLGPMRFLSIDDEWLLIDFDANGRVARYRWAAD